MKGIRFSNWFSEKNSRLVKWTILGPKMAHPHNFGSAVRIFLKFCTTKGANNKFLFEEMGHFGPENGTSS